MHAHTRTYTQRSLGKEQASGLILDTVPRPVGREYLGGGPRWSCSGQLRPVSALRALRKKILSPGWFLKVFYMRSPTSSLSSLVFGMSHDRGLSLGQGQGTEKSETPWKREAKPKFSK